MDKNSLLKETIRRLLRRQKFGVLATQGAVYPYTSVVGFAVTSDLSTLVFPTAKATSKYRNIQADPHVAMLVGSHKNLARDFQAAKALTLLGVARACRGAERDVFAKLLLSRHPSLTHFVRDPQAVLVCVAVKKYLLVTRFQNVQELTVK